MPDPNETPTWAPSVQDVADLLAVRTGDDNDGDEAGTFNSDTRPSATAVERLIEVACGEVVDVVERPVPERYEDDARRLASLRTAVLIESSYFQDEIDSDSSPHRQYLATYLAGVERLHQRLAPMIFIA